MSEAIQPVPSHHDGDGDGDEVRVEYRDGSGRAISSTVYCGIHLSCLLALYTGVNTTDLLLLALTFWVRMFAITGGYHRYFSHRTYKTSRAFQLALAVLGTTAVQKGPLWWASIHRLHHRDSDGENDPHSPRKGFWYAHQSWIFDGRWDDTRTELVRDFLKFPELVLLNRLHFVPPLIMSAICIAVGGLSGLVWGMGISTVLGWHATYSINSLAHRIGRARYDTGDDSKNSMILALLTMGEGWHNNHHHHQSCARQGFFWWEIDVTYYALLGLAKIGVIWDIKQPPARVYGAEPRDEPLREAA